MRPSFGARPIACLLNAEGHRLRGANFANGNVADILARTANIGYYIDEKKTELGETLPEAEWQRVS